MKKIVVVVFVYIIFCGALWSQKLPYGNNSQAGHYVQANDANYIMRYMVVDSLLYYCMVE
jgi:hypothetical protein